MYPAALPQGSSQFLCDQGTHIIMKKKERKGLPLHCWPTQLLCLKSSQLLRDQGIYVIMNEEEKKERQERSTPLL